MKIFIVVSVILLITAFFLMGIINTSYTIFVEEQKNQTTGQCSSLYQNCRCFGILKASFGVSDQYSCFGFNYCSEININKCR